MAFPKLHSIPLPEERYGFMQPDPDLMWSLKPNQNLQMHFKGVPDPVGIQTNSQGLRDAEVLEKQDNEYRILSLGESSTFGAYVDNHDTYSAKLEKFLNETDSTRRYRVINGGVSAYSSFQSLLYLKVRGVKLKPDMVLFYHEFNDYLPSSLRSSQNTESGLARTVKQLYESKQGAASRHLMAHSALYRFLSYKWHRYQVSRFTRSQEEETAETIGFNSMNDIAIFGVLGQSGDEEKPYKLKHDALPRRVSPRERQEILEELRLFCEQENIELIIIHPSYAVSEKHTCILTAFCREKGVPMFEAQEFLHPPNVLVQHIYLDPVHPSPYGHQLLANALTPFILDVIGSSSGE